MHNIFLVFVVLLVLSPSSFTRLFHISFSSCNVYVPDVGFALKKCQEKILQ